jgi:hypothetical protein
MRKRIVTFLLAAAAAAISGVGSAAAQEQPGYTVSNVTVSAPWDALSFTLTCDPAVAQCSSTPDIRAFWNGIAVGHQWWRNGGPQIPCSTSVGTVVTSTCGPAYVGLQTAQTMTTLNVLVAGVEVVDATGSWTLAQNEPGAPSVSCSIASKTQLRCNYAVGLLPPVYGSHATLTTDAFEWWGTVFTANQPASQQNQTINLPSAQADWDVEVIQQVDPSVIPPDSVIDDNWSSDLSGPQFDGSVLLNTSALGAMARIKR